MFGHDWMHDLVKTKRKNPDLIRTSTEADIRAIHAWLKQEDSDGVYDNFLCNWEQIEKRHQDGRLTVYVDGPSNVPVAYQLGGLIHPGILQVRSDMRRKGIGKKLVAHCMEEALKKDECLLLIQCTTKSSIPFWQSMGFTLFGDPPHQKKAYRILPKRHQLPPGGQRIDATARFFPEDRKWKGGETLAPYHSAVPTAMLMPDGVIHLSERVSFFRDIHPDARDAVIEITVNGERRYCDKAKSSEAKRMGVRTCSNGFYIDRIYSTEAG